MRLPVRLTRTVARRVLTLKKQSPHIFFAGGVVGAVASTVLACRATLRLEETLEHIQLDLKSVEDMKSNPRLLHDEDGEFELQKLKVECYIKGTLELSKLYAPAIIVGTVSIGMLTGSHVQLSRRNAAVMAAYAAVQEAYDNYRERVRAQLGDERELELYHAVETEIIKENGTKKEIKSTDPTKFSPYARMFDEYQDRWQKDPELNRMFLHAQQEYANQLLRVRGHVFLNEVYDSLGLERSSAGQVVGWVINDKNGPGDNYIDFGLYEARNSRFINGNEPSIILDFNVDGIIYDKI